MANKKRIASDVAEKLAEFNKWRRGEGIYAFNENPEINNKQFPISPKELGEVIDVAERLLKGITGETCDCDDCALKGMSLCEYREYQDAVDKLRMSLLMTNQLLGDIAGALYDHDMHNEENAVTDMISANLNVLEETDFYKKSKLIAK